MTLNSMMKWPAPSFSDFRRPYAIGPCKNLFPSYFGAFSRSFPKSDRLFPAERSSLFLASLLSAPGFRSASRGR
jgi:hypothetical protein